jgi:hypothetical protein
MSEAMKDNQTANTCRELWREREDEFAGVISVDPSGLVFINYKGSVIGRPLAEWHRLALAQAEAAAELTRLRDERDRLREEVEAKECPVEVWRKDRKVTIYHDSVLQVWGADIDSEMSDKPRTHEAIQAAIDWLYADALTAEAALAQARE